MTMHTLKVDGKNYYLRGSGRYFRVTPRKREAETMGSMGHAIGGLMRHNGEWLYRLGITNAKHGIGKGLTRKQALTKLVQRRKAADKAKKTRAKNADRCTCRKPKTHRDCCYCGFGWSAAVCGVCREAGIDGPVIRGTERRTCKLHKTQLTTGAK